MLVFFMDELNIRTVALVLFILTIIWMKKTLLQKTLLKKTFLQNRNLSIEIFIQKRSGQQHEVFNVLWLNIVSLRV